MVASFMLKFRMLFVVYSDKLINVETRQIFNVL